MANYPKLKIGWLGGLREFRITSPFGPRRFNGHTYHNGIDIGIVVNTPIYAPFSGTLKGMGIGGGGAGLYCTLQSGNLMLRFMHLNWCMLGESRGGVANVKEGQLIAKTGGARGHRLAGASTGPHLHFEYIYNNVHINPVHVVSEKLIVAGRGLNLGITSRKTGRIYTSGNNNDTSSISNNASKGGLSKYERIKKRRENHPIVGDNNSMVNTSVSESEMQSMIDNTNSALETDIYATENIDLDEKPKETKEGKAKGIWQIIKLAMDGNVASLMLFDAAISQQTGSLMNFFNKACQQPLVEFSGDTFGDQYYFLVRRPPFDKEGMVKALNTQHMFEVDVQKLEAELGKLKEDSGKYWADERTDEATTNWRTRLKEWYKKYGGGTEYWNRVQQLEDDIRNGKEIQNEYLQHANPYIIENKDIINSNISFNTQGIYSWYQFYPQYELAGDKMQYIVPAVMFPEYAAIWGSRSLQIQSQYASFKGLGTRDAQRNGLKDEVSDKRCRSILDDLKYLIESNAYNPFVRQGTLTIIGTRRIRRGMFVEVCIESGVPEIFYVEGVSHNYSIANKGVNDTVTLQLSHGMVKRFITGIDMSESRINYSKNGTTRNYSVNTNDGNKKISYFDLIEFKDYEKNRNNLNIGNWREVISHWAVNKEVFKFFLQKKQFIETDFVVFF